MPYTLTDQRVIHLFPTLISLGYNNEEATPAISYINIDSRDAGIDEQFTTITTQGTLVTHEKDVLDIMRLNLTNQVWAYALTQAALGVPTTTGITGVTARNGYDGQYNSRNFEIRVEMRGTDLNSGTDVTYRVTFWRVNVKQMRPFSTLTAKQVIEQTFQVTVSKTLVNLLGTGIVGLKNATTGDYYSHDKLA